MKILFVCRNNTGRSQVSEEFYNLFTGSKDAKSAGTKVDKVHQLVGDRIPAQAIIEVMKEQGIDMPGNKRKQVTQVMVDEFDKVIVMAEQETIPKWLKNSDKYEYWHIEDMKNFDKVSAAKVAGILKEKVSDLVFEKS